MRLINLFAIISTLLVFFLAVNTTFAAKIVGKDEKSNIVTLNTQYKKGTRLRVFIGNQKIGLIESLGGNKAKIIYGKKEVDIGATVYAIENRNAAMRFSYVYLPFVKIEPNPQYVLLTGVTPSNPSSTGFRLRFRYQFIDATGFIGGAGLTGGYSELGNYLKGFEFGANFIVGMEVRPEVLELHLYSDVGILIGFNELNWARPERKYDDNIFRNMGKATVSSPAGYIDIGGGIDWRISEKLSLYIYSAYSKYSLEDGHWNDSARENNDEIGYDIKNEWLEYKADKLKGITLEIGLRLNRFVL